MASLPSSRSGPSNLPDAYAEPDRLGGGFALAFGLHLLVAAALVAAAYLDHSRPDRWGERQASVGAIQASMVSALPLPAHAKPVEKQVLASEDENQAPLPPPKEAAAPPPRPTDVLIKAKTPPKKPAPLHTEAPPKPQPRAIPSEVTPPKRVQPAPPSPKAMTGETAATQLPQAVSQTRNGTATASVEDRAFGARYAYYLRLVSQKVSQNWVASEADPRSSQGKRVTLLFDIDRDGTPGEVRVETRSTSPSLDQSALHAVQRIDSFGPLPAGNKITIEFSFDYKSP